MREDAGTWGIGTWLRAYTTSLKSTTILGQLVEYCQMGNGYDEPGVRLRNAQMEYVVPLSYVIGEEHPKYGFSFEHDQALDLCIAEYPACPFGCTKDGAPNCYANVMERRCEPGRKVIPK